MNSPTPVNENLPWWRERMVWLVIALPVSAVLAGIATIFIAAHDPDDLVKTEYTKTGMVVDASREAARQAAKLGLTATLSERDGTLLLTLNHQQNPEGRLTLYLVHPTRADMDQQIPLLHLGQGQYQARTTLSGEGKRRLILEPPDRNWQLLGEWQAPFNEETSLSASSSINPSTHP